MRNFSEEIEKTIDLLLKVSDDSSKKKLLDKSKVVYLQVVLFKIPFGPQRKRKFLSLCHSLYGDDPEICLFVPNRKTNVKYKKTSDELIDFCIDYYTELLEKHKVKGISSVMPLKQLKSEYGTYDLRRKLVRRFDLFLCKNSLLYNPRFLNSLGKIFREAKKEPLGVSFPKEDVDFDPEFQKNIDRAILSSSFVISRFSDNYSIPFGCLSNTKVELKENLQAVLNQLFDKNIIPGGLKNVRAMNLWPSQSKPIPFYINTELPEDMKTPSIKLKRKRKFRGVEGEISTQPYSKVFVRPNGEVFVTKIKNNSKKPEFSDSESDFVDESDEEVITENKKNSKIKGESEEESESENDEEIEKREARLMKGKMLSGENSYSQYRTPQELKNEKEEEEEEPEPDKVIVKRKKKVKSLNVKLLSQEAKSKENKKIKKEYKCKER